MSDTPLATPAASGRPAGFLQNLIRKRHAATEATAEELRAALAEAEADKAAAHDQITALTAAQGDVILDADADATAAHDAALRAANEAWRRAKALIPALTGRLSAAEAREAEAAAQAEKAEAERQAEAAAAALAICEHAAAELLAASRRADAAVRALEAANGRLRDAGRADLKVTIATRDTVLADLHKSVTAAGSHLSTVRQRGSFNTEWRERHAAEQARAFAEERARQDAQRERETPRGVATIIKGW